MAGTVQLPRRDPVQREHGRVALVDVPAADRVPPREVDEGRAIELACQDGHLGALHPHRSRATLEAGIQKRRAIVVAQHLNVTPLHVSVYVRLRQRHIIGGKQLR